MARNYIHYNKVTREILDSIEVGDLVKVNDWTKPMRVKAVSENYFVMTQKIFGHTCYSVCSKLPWKGKVYNSLVGGMFYCGPDYWVLGHELCFDYDDLYEFTNDEANKLYLESFEKGESKISERRGLAIYDLFIKKGKK